MHIPMLNETGPGAKVTTPLVGNVTVTAALIEVAEDEAKLKLVTCTPVMPPRAM